MDTESLRILIWKAFLSKNFESLLSLHCSLLLIPIVKGIELHNDKMNNLNPTQFSLPKVVKTVYMS